MYFGGEEVKISHTEKFLIFNDVSLNPAHQRP